MPKDPLVNFIEELTKLTTFLNSKKFQDVKDLPDYMESQIIILERCAEIMTNLKEKMFRQLDLNAEEVQELIDHPENLPQREKKALIRLQKVKRETEEKQKHLEMQLNKTASKKTAKTRQKKFTRAGARKDWKPL